MRCARARSHTASGLACALAALLFVATAARADDTDDTKHLLGLLDGIRIEYIEAFDDDEAELTRPVELEEARILLAEARQLDGPLRLVATSSFETIERELHGVVLADTLPDLVTGLMARITASTGVALQTLPADPPSAARGRVLFAENCAVCHGADGAGTGDAAERRQVQHANFTDRTFMRRETPLDFFTMISLGRRKTAMPAWSKAFSVQQRWDVIAYVWTLAHPAAERREGEAIYGAHCAECHGTRGEGVADKAPDLSRPGSLIDRNDVTLVTRLSKARGEMPSFGATLDDRQRWLAADHLRALSLGGAGAVTTAAALPPAPAAAVVPSVAPAPVDPRRALEAAGIDSDAVTRDVGEHMQHRFETPPAR